MESHLVKFTGFKQFLNPPFLDQVLMREDGGAFGLLREGKCISGRFDRHIWVDQTPLVLSPKGREIGIVNFAGTGSDSACVSAAPTWS